MTLPHSHLVGAPWRRAAAVGAAGMMVLGIVAPTLLLPALLVLSGFLAGAVGLVVARRARGIDRNAWTLLGIGQLANGIGNLSFLGGEHFVVATSWTITAVFNIGTLVTVMGMFAFVAPSGDRRRLAAFAADSVMVCGCAFVVIWTWRLTDYIGAANQQGTVLGAMAVLGLVLDAMGLALTPAIIRSRPPGARGALWMAVFALVIAAVGDLDQALTAIRLPEELAPLGWLMSSSLLLVGATLVQGTAERVPRKPLRGPLDFTSAAILATTLTLLLGGRTLDGVARLTLLALTVLIVGRHMVVYSSNRRLRRELQYQAFHDRLTGLPNRSQFERELAGALDAASTATVLFGDLDGFKEINDTYGHAAGDAVLVAIGRRLHTAVGPAVRVFRLGGDEFTALLPAAMDRDQVAELTRVAQRAVAQPIQYRERSLAVTLSAGLSWRGEGSAEAVMMQADLSLHAAKRLGRNRFLFYHDELRHLASRRYNAEGKLGAAIAAGELQLAYQPIRGNPLVPATAGPEPLQRFEALLRWPDEQGGSVLPPNDVVELVEALGRTRELTRWAVATVFDQLRVWRLGGLEAEVALNLTAAQLRSVQLLDLVRLHSHRTGIDVDRLIAEITESEVAGDDDITAMLRQMQDAGIRVSLDDFGTGYSNFTTVIALPIDDLKLDQTFLSGPQLQGRRRRVMAAVVHLAHDVGLTVTVEGIETREQYRLAAELGADRLQGFLLGRPAPAESFLDRLSPPQPPADRPPVQPTAGP